MEHGKFWASAVVYPAIISRPVRRAGLAAHLKHVRQKITLGQPAEGQWNGDTRHYIYTPIQTRRGLARQYRGKEGSDLIQAVPSFSSSRSQQFLLSPSFQACSIPPAPAAQTPAGLRQPVRQPPRAAHTAPRTRRRKLCRSSKQNTLGTGATDGDHGSSTAEDSIFWAPGLFILRSS